MKANNERLRNVIGFVLFLIVLFRVFSNVTYFFRNTSYDRNNVVGIKNERDIDVVYIGGSAALTYWEPYRAYNEYGFTSYDLATNSICAENILPYIKFAERYQNPDLYIIGIRAFQYYSDEMDDVGLRNTSDSMSLTDIERYGLITEYLQNRDTDDNTDLISYYLDISKYHTNYANFGKTAAYGFINNDGEALYKGFQSPYVWAYLEKSKDYKTDERAELLPNAQKELDKILAYCDKKGLNVLFVVCPYAIIKEHYAVYNTIADEVREHGYDYLNANDYYEEIGIDFAKDFYNGSHTNVYGADKYTSFLAKYIGERYNLPDHRNDSSFSDWDEGVGIFEWYLGKRKNLIDEMISGADIAVELGTEIRATDEFAKWSHYVKDEHYSLIWAGNSESINNVSTADKKTLEYLGVNCDELFGTSNYMKIIAQNADQAILDEATDYRMIAHVGQAEYRIEVTINNEDNKYSVIIDDKECSRRNKNGVNVVVFDNYYRTIIDSITLKAVEGNLVIER